MPKQGSSEAKASLYLGCDTANINGLITDAHFAKEINLYDVNYFFILLSREKNLALIT